MTNESKLPILTVSQLTHAIKLNLESAFPSIWVQGEVSNCKLHSSGHLYLSIKDPTSQITAIMYRADVASLSAIPKDGGQVIAYGEINVYPAGGKYQLIIKELRPVGLGELLQKLEELKVKLLKKGYFKKEHKKLLPKFPRKIGVVTSPTGAAIQDILNILSRRFSGFHLILNPVRVQGEGAAREIAQAIEQFNMFGCVDVMIVGRGGGSVEDLWAFNEEIVAEAIYHSKIPIISAVGHETDHCIADYVADVRAPTPSAAAEMVISEKSHHLHHLNQIQRRLHQTLSHVFRHHRHQLDSMRRHPLFQTPYGLLGPWMQKLDDVREELHQTMRHQLARRRLLLEACQKQVQSLKPTQQLAHYRQRLNALNKNMRTLEEAKILHLRRQVKNREIQLHQWWLSHQRQWKQKFNFELKRKQLDFQWKRLSIIRREQLTKIGAALNSIDPKNLLAKGYTILFSEKDHSVISSVRTLTEGTTIRMLLSDGEAQSTVNKVTYS
jgi:exodeoxyribonuclease VII large subunit